MSTTDANVLNLDPRSPRQPPDDVFGRQFERAKFIHDALSTKEQTKTWIVLSTALFLPLVLVIGLVYAFIDYVVAPGNTGTDASEYPQQAATPKSLAISYTHPISSMTDSEFQVYLGFFLWITIILAGIGLEFVVFVLLPAKWSSKVQSYWMLAQTLFSLFVATAVGMAISLNYAALPIFVAGMWKFGFPQTITLMFIALNDISLNRLQRFGYFVNAVGLLIHHTAGGLAISVAATGLGNMANARIVFDAILIAMMQHWFFFLRYIHKNTYIAVELILEFWFEWITVSNLEGLFAYHWSAALFGGTFLVAHWLFLGAAAVETFAETLHMRRSKKTDEPADIEIQGLASEENSWESAESEQ
jgi:uncharacterized protein YjeT (DUF2065 family)